MRGEFYVLFFIDSLFKMAVKFKASQASRSVSAAPAVAAPLLSSIHGVPHCARRTNQGFAGRLLNVQSKRHCSKSTATTTTVEEVPVNGRALALEYDSVLEKELQENGAPIAFDRLSGIRRLLLVSCCWRSFSHLAFLKFLRTLRHKIP